MIFAHVQTGKLKLIIIGVENPILVDFVGRGALKFLVTGKVFLQDIDRPDQARLERRQGRARLQNNLPLKGDLLPGQLILDQGKRDIEKIAAIPCWLHGNIVFLQQLCIERAIRVTGQIAKIGQRDFEHGRQPNVTIGIGGHGAVTAAAHFADVKERLLIPILHIALLVFGPIEDIKGVPQMIGLGGAQLEINKGIAVGL